MDPIFLAVCIALLVGCGGPLGLLGLVALIALSLKWRRLARQRENQLEAIQRNSAERLRDLGTPRPVERNFGHPPKKAFTSTLPPPSPRPAASTPEVPDERGDAHTDTLRRQTLRPAEVTPQGWDGREDSQEGQHTTLMPRGGEPNGEFYGGLVQITDVTPPATDRSEDDVGTAHDELPPHPVGEAESGHLLDENEWATPDNGARLPTSHRLFGRPPGKR